MEAKKSVGRPRTFEKEEVLRLAMLHFWEHGYDGTSLEKLLEAMGIKKSSFYRIFRSKEEVFSQSLDLYRKETFAWLEELKKAHGVRESLMALVTYTMDQLRTDGKVKGCLVMNSGKECYQRYDDLSRQIRVEYRAMADFVTGFIREGQASGEIPHRTEPEKLALRFLVLYTGIINLLQAGAEGEEVEDLLAFVRDLLA